MIAGIYCFVQNYLPKQLKNRANNTLFIFYVP